MRIKRAAKLGMYQIAAWDESGHEWRLNRTFRMDDPLLYRTLERIRAKKEINLRYWRMR